MKEIKLLCKVLFKIGVEQFENNWRGLHLFMFVWGLS